MVQGGVEAGVQAPTPVVVMPKRESMGKVGQSQQRH